MIFRCWHLRRSEREIKIKKRTNTLAVPRLQWLPLRRGPRGRTETKDIEPSWNTNERLRTTIPLAGMDGHEYNTRPRKHAISNLKKVDNTYTATGDELAEHHQWDEVPPTRQGKGHAWFTRLIHGRIHTHTGHGELRVSALHPDPPWNACTQWHASANLQNTFSALFTLLKAV